MGCLGDARILCSQGRSDIDLNYFGKAHRMSQLFEMAESMQPTVDYESPRRRGGKRQRLVENPIVSLLRSITSSTNNANICARHLQTLTFFVDQHWSKVHDQLRQTVITTLTQLLSSIEDTMVQSWVFLSLAAIAHAEVPSLDSQPDNLPPSHSTNWGIIWTHSMRRINLPGICRAASHMAYILLKMKGLVIHNEILSEIETTLAKDLDVQGPTYPYDSVCAFLNLCLTVAAQDVRLYRLQIDEKILSWLMVTWRMGEMRLSKGSKGKGAYGRASDRLPPYVAQDLLMLLQSVVGVSRQATVFVAIPLPSCTIVAVLTEQLGTRVIREFLLESKLPAQPNSSVTVTDRHQRKQVNAAKIHTELVRPQGCERKISTYLYHSLESLVLAWEIVSDAHILPTAEQARQSLDFAVIALIFESTLALNGISSTKRVVQYASKLLRLTLVTLADNNWTMTEKLLLLQGLEILLPGAPNHSSQLMKWEAILPPSQKSGIGIQQLNRLMSSSSVGHHSDHAFYHLLWQHEDVSDHLLLSALLRRQYTGSRMVGSHQLHRKECSRPISVAKQQSRRRC